MNARTNDTRKNKGLSSGAILLAAICLLSGCSTIDVSSTPSGARVFVNDADTGMTTPASIKVRRLPLGRTSITVEKEGYQSVPQKQEVETRISVGNIVWSVIWPPVVIKNLCDNFWKRITYPRRGRLKDFILQPVSGAPSATTSVQAEVPAPTSEEPPKRALITNADVVAMINVQENTNIERTAENVPQKTETTPSSTKADVKTTFGESAGNNVGTVPFVSKFAKISIGMPMKEVFDLIGRPTEMKTHTRWKAFVPLYFGGDGARSEALYKGEGSIIFKGGANRDEGSFSVYRIVNNPKESGYSK